jgi:hypothetical protein
MVLYNVLFGLVSAAHTACTGHLSAFCMESRPCSIGSAHSWESALFSLSLCALLCLQLVAYSISVLRLSPITVSSNLDESAYISAIEIGNLHIVTISNVPKLVPRAAF